MLIVVATILLCYFDLRYDNMRLQAVFLGTNVVGAIGSIAAGFPFMATAISWLRS
jgi:hypothetical protein